MSDLLKGRDFQFWEYRVSHGQLLIRSPTPAYSQLPTIDVMFFAVEYVELVRYLGEIEIGPPNEETKTRVALLLGSRSHSPFQLSSGPRRYLVGAHSMAVGEFRGEIFDSPFDRPTKDGGPIV